MKSFLSFAVLFVAFAAQAASPKIPVSKISGANWYCSSEGAMYAINLKDKRVWQSDIGQAEGIELSDVKIDILRCRNCYNIRGVLMNFAGVSIILRNTPALVPAGKVTVTARLSGQVETEEFNVRCSAFNK